MIRPVFDEADGLDFLQDDPDYATLPRHVEASVFEKVAKPMAPCELTGDGS